MNFAIIIISVLLALGAAVNTGSPLVGAAASSAGAAMATPTPTPTPAPAPKDIISGGGPTH